MGIAKLLIYLIIYINRFVPREKMNQKCDPIIREECGMTMRTECQNLCKEKCANEDKKVCMTIPHQECNERPVENCQDVPSTNCRKVSSYQNETSYDTIQMHIIFSLLVFYTQKC